MVVSNCPLRLWKKIKPVSSVMMRLTVKEITEHWVDDDIPELEVTPDDDLCTAITSHISVMNEGVRSCRNKYWNASKLTRVDVEDQRHWDNWMAFLTQPLYYLVCIILVKPSKLLRSLQLPVP